MGPDLRRAATGSPLRKRNGVPLARYAASGQRPTQNEATRLPNPIARASDMASRFWPSSGVISSGYATEASRCTFACSTVAALPSPQSDLCDSSRAISRSAASIGGQSRQPQRGLHAMDLAIRQHGAGVDRRTKFRRRSLLRRSRSDRRERDDACKRRLHRFFFTIVLTYRTLLFVG